MIHATTIRLDQEFYRRLKIQVGSRWNDFAKLRCSRCLKSI
jgi:hypothetical protein